MSAPKLTKKQKKGLAFRERKTKRNTNALDEDLAVPEADPLVEESTEKDDINPKDLLKNQTRLEWKVGVVNPKSRPTESLSKPEKRKRDPGLSVEEESVEPAGTITDVAPRKTKKQKLNEIDDPQEEDGKEKTMKSGTSRFILFVGNLKYTTSLEAIQEHFSKCDPPPQVRLLTPKPKAPGTSNARSKGCAFLEFTHRNALQQGLKLHGSTLDDRRINVELTAGGGGKSDKRLKKVQTRNKQLVEERKAHVQKTVDAGGKANTDIIAPPQRHSKTSGVDNVPQQKRTWTVPEDGEASGRGGVKKRGKKGKTLSKSWGTGANSIAVG
ncbi:hypothetical protein BU17DRAFT_50755 [Hysterangium stoloniferum]|nr:hypothetical protein BU17DRAFT_50755 [Hysterangium stoloniferum]